MEKDVDADPASGREKGYQFREFFISRCGLQSKEKIYILIVPKAIRDIRWQ